MLARMVDGPNVDYHDYHMYAFFQRMAPHMLKKQLETTFSYAQTPQVCYQQVFSLCSSHPFSFSPKIHFED